MVERGVVSQMEEYLHYEFDLVRARAVQFMANLASASENAREYVLKYTRTLQLMSSVCNRVGAKIDEHMQLSFAICLRSLVQGPSFPLVVITNAMECLKELLSSKSTCVLTYALKALAELLPK